MLSLLFSACLAAAAPDSPSGPVVRLPQMTVEGTALPRDEHPWRHIAFPGYEILSQTSESDTARLAEDLLTFDDAVARVYPAVKATRAVQTTVLVCVDRAVFESFVPANVRAAMNLADVNRLFLENDDRPMVVVYAGGSIPTARYEVDLNRGTLAAHLRTVYPALPAWYVEGISHLFAEAEITPGRAGTTVLVGQVDRRPAPALPADVDGISVSDEVVADPSKGVPTAVARIVQGDILRTAITQVVQDGAISTPADPDSHQVACLKYFADRSQRPPALAAIFAGPPATGYQDWVEGCSLLCHYCLFGWNRASSAKLLQFVLRASQTPSADPVPLFTAAFGVSAAHLRASLDQYVQGPAYHAWKYSFPKPAGALSPVLLAAVSEAAEIKASALTLAGYSAAAGQELHAAYRQRSAGADADLRLLAALGVWEAEQGNPEGDRLLSAAAAKGYPDARLYAEQARRRLAAFAADHALSENELGYCQQPLFAARAVGAADRNTDRLLAQSWERAAQAPAINALAVLAEGIRQYPEDPELAYAAAADFLRSGNRVAAQVVIRRELNSGDAATRARFAALQARL